MKPPLFVGPLTDRDKQQLEAGLRSPDAFTLRRGQILLASARGYRPSQIAPILGCSVQSIRDAIRAFRAEGVGCLRAKPKAPKAVHAAWPKDRDDDLRAPHLRQADQPVDSAPGCPGLPREGLDPARAQRRKYPPGAQAAGRRLEAGQALDDQP
jgi:DNA-binding CsgD family transcriptional regulator